LDIETRILCALSKSNTNISVNSSVKDKIYQHINSEKDVSEMYLPKNNLSNDKLDINSCNS